MVHSRDYKEIGVAHAVKSHKNQPQFSQVTMRQYWLGKTKPKQTFRSAQNAFFGVDFFSCLTLLQPKRCLLAYRSECNEFFRDVPVPSFVFHSSLLIVKLIWRLHIFSVTEIIYIFHSSYLDYRGTFHSYCCVTSLT